MTARKQHYKTVILGAGAAGMMCAVHAGPGTLVVDHARAPGEKIRISGGGRCNFTNLHVRPETFLSGNRHFAKSALSRYTQHDFIALVQRHGIAYHEKTLGQLFCDESSKEIVAMLVDELRGAGADLWLQTHVGGIARRDGRFEVSLTRDGRAVVVVCDALVIACGGKSIPKMGATGLGYQIAEQFGLALEETRPGLVPLTFADTLRERFKGLAGVALSGRVRCGKTGFDEAILFTHRGLSGPAILQISSYWREGQPITVSLLPGTDLSDALSSQRRSQGRRAVSTVLADYMPKRLAQDIAQAEGLQGNLADLSDKRLAVLERAVNAWSLIPNGSEGYRTAEVTLGGVSTKALDARTMQAKSVPGLYFIGEVVDVTGWLGGYNFQWAWSSGWAAGTAIAARQRDA